jgi:hypothetical protein
MCLVFCFQKHLSLRTQVVNPLVLVFIVLGSTAALVRAAWGLALLWSTLRLPASLLPPHVCC